MTTNNRGRSIEEKRRRRRLFWLCIAGGTGALTLIAPAIFVAMGGTLRYPGANYLPNSPPQAWYYVLGIGILLGNRANAQHSHLLALHRQYGEACDVV